MIASQRSAPVSFARCQLWCRVACPVYGRLSCPKATPLDHSQLRSVGQTSASNESAELQAVLETDASLLDLHRCFDRCELTCLRTAFGRCNLLHESNWLSAFGVSAQSDWALTEKGNHPRKNRASNGILSAQTGYALYIPNCQRSINCLS